MSLDLYFARLRPLLGEALVISSNVNEEAHGNLGLIPISSELAQKVPTDALVRFLHDVMDARRRQLPEGARVVLLLVRRAGRATALRCDIRPRACASLSSPVNPRVTLQQVVAAFLASTDHDGIPWRERPDSNTEDGDAAPPVVALPVFVPCLEGLSEELP